MSIIKFFIRMILILLVIFILGGFLIPDEWTVSRSILINAKPETIYPYISNFKKMDKWMPENSNKDNTLQYTYEGPETGVGSKQIWTSKKMGSGWITITEANPKTGIAYELFVDLGLSQSTLHGSVTMAPKDQATEVTWTDKGNSQKSFVRRWISLLFKPLVIADLNKGLLNLKNLVEKDAKKEDKLKN